MFSTLDLASGYWQIPLTEDAKLKSAFVCHRGLFQWNRMPFGLSNAPPTFQRAMNVVLSGEALNWEKCLCYLDDIIVFGTTFEDHLKALDRVFERLAEAGLQLKASKCELFKEKLEYLGHVVTSEGVFPQPDKLQAVSEWKTPKNIHDVRSFLGLCSYLREWWSVSTMKLRPAIYGLNDSHAHRTPNASFSRVSHFLSGPRNSLEMYRVGCSPSSKT